jgi:hypothetical protein
MSSEFDDEWSQSIAVLIADALVDGGVITREQMPRAIEIAAEELYVRCTVKDFPPSAIAAAASGNDGNTAKRGPQSRSG